MKIKNIHYIYRTRAHKGHGFNLEIIFYPITLWCNLPKFAYFLLHMVARNSLNRINFGQFKGAATNQEHS